MKKLAIATCLLMVSIFSFAQEKNNISVADFEAGVDTFNYDYSLYLLRDKNPSLATEFENLRRTQVSFEDMQDFLSKKASPANLQISEEINSLKVRYEENDETLRNLLTTNIYTDSSLKSFNKAHNQRSSNTDYDNFVESMYTKLLIQLGDSLNSEPTQQGKKVEIRSTEEGYNLYDSGMEQKESEWFWYALVGFISFGAGIILTSIIKPKQNKRLKNHTNLNVDFSQSEIEFLRRNLNEKKQEVIRLQEENTLLRNQLQKDRETAERASMYQPIPVDQLHSATENIMTYGTRYFPNPTSEGYFIADNSRETFTEGASIYKFTLTSPSDATFEFCEDPSSVKMALNNRNELLLSVAEEANAYYTTANKIVATEPGKAILEGSIWKVTRKAKIKYI